MDDWTLSENNFRNVSCCFWNYFSSQVQLITCSRVCYSAIYRVRNISSLRKFNFKQSLAIYIFWNALFTNGNYFQAKSSHPQAHKCLIYWQKLFSSQIQLSVWARMSYLLTAIICKPPSIIHMVRNALSTNYFQTTYIQLFIYSEFHQPTEIDSKPSLAIHII